MLPLTLHEVAAACGGRIDGVSRDTVATGISIDSRQVRPGDLFVALAGTRVDGHAFGRDAVDRGAVAVLAREGEALDRVPAVIVADPTPALGAIAATVRGRSGARVVAITGSSGKTCTKQLTAAALGPRFRVTASTASYNNEIGVPLTICSLDSETEVLVVEVGSRGIGHIAALMPIVRPDVSVVTNVGSAHFEMFGSLEVTARAKAELVEGLGAGGTAVLNADDPAVSAMGSLAPDRVVTFGSAGDADVRAGDVELDELARARFEVEAPSGRAKVELRVSGEHMVSDALAALAVAEVFAVPIDDAAAALGEVPPAAWRMEVSQTPGGVAVINDAYNANPASAAAALKALVAMGGAGARRTWAVLGEMAELGPISAQEHDRLGRLAARLGVHRLVAVGEAARPACEAARLECMTPEEAVFVPHADAAIALLREGLAPGDVVLVKASRAAGLERVAHALTGEAHS